jgi:hypothetical protein
LVVAVVLVDIDVQLQVNHLVAVHLLKVLYFLHQELLSQ